MIWYEPLNPPEKNPVNPGYILVSGVGMGTTVTLQAFADVYVGTSPFTLFGGSPLGGTYTGTCVTANVFDPACVGAGNSVTITYTIIVGGQPYSASQPINVIATPPAQQSIVTKIGWTFYDTNVPNLSDPVRLPFFVALGLQTVYYIRFPGTVNATNAATINTFITAIGATLGIYVGLPQGAGFPFDSFTIIDQLKTTFAAPIREFWQYLQESQMDSPTYAIEAEDYQTYIAEQGSLDTPSMFRTGGQFVARWAACATVPNVDTGRQYINFANQITFVANNDTNYANLQNYFDVLLPADFAKFFNEMPNLQFINVINWLIEDASHYVDDTPLESWTFSKTVEWVLLHTANYNYLLRLGSFFNGNVPNGVYDAIKRLTPLFTYTFVDTWNFGITGLTGLLVSKANGDCAFLVNNNTNATQTVLAATVPNILTQFTRNNSTGSSWGGAITNNVGIVETDLTIQPYSATVATFSRTP